jgi:hypothetical protein
MTGMTTSALGDTETCGDDFGVGSIGAGARGGGGVTGDFDPGVEYGCGVGLAGIQRRRG